MRARFRRFLSDELGATTVDWVVLSAACIGLALTMMSTMNGSTSSVASALGTSLGSVTVAPLGTLGGE